MRFTRAGMGILIVVALVVGFAPITRGAEHGGSEDRLTCADVDTNWHQVALTGHPLSGHYTVQDEQRSIQVFVYDGAEGGKLVNWKADGPIDAAILRSGQDAAVYEYEPPRLSATSLQPPLKDRDGRNLAAVIFCYDPGDVDVNLDLRMSDTADPVTVGAQFDYLVEATATQQVDAEVVVTLPAQVSAVTAPGCLIEDATVTCGAQLQSGETWRTLIAVEAVRAGDAVARAVLYAALGEEEWSVTAVEATRILVSEGGDCGDHDDGDCEGGDGGGSHDLSAVCSSVDPDWSSLVLDGPFASRRYLLRGADGVVLTVTVSETSTGQSASWRSNVPIDAALARTGREVETYRYPYPTFFGSGVQAPPSNSGAPRPMADLGFCYLPRLPIDLALSLTEAVGPTVETAGVLTATLSHAGYADVERVYLYAETSENLEAASCAGAAWDAGPCRLGRLAAGSSLEIGVGLTGTEEGPGWMELRAVGIGADGTLVGEAADTLELSVLSEPAEEEDGPGASSATTTTDTIGTPSTTEAMAGAPSDAEGEPGSTDGDGMARTGTSASTTPAELPHTGSPDLTSFAGLALLLFSLGLMLVVSTPSAGEHLRRRH